MHYYGIVTMTGISLSHVCITLNIAMEQSLVDEEEVSQSLFALNKEGVRNEAKDKKLFEMVYEMMEEVQTACEPIAKRSASPDNSVDDDMSSGESGGEEECIQQQQENLEDLQKEMDGLEISEETSTLETLILIVEFYIKNGDVEGFRKNMRRPDKWLMSSSPRPKIDDVLKMADNLVTSDLLFRAVLMHKCASALYKYEYVRDLDEVAHGDVTPDDAIRGIEACMKKVLRIFESLEAAGRDCEKAIYLPHFVPVMYDMVTNLREIRHADRRLKADREAWGLIYIAFVHGQMGETVEMRDVAETAQKLLEKRRRAKGAAHSLSLFLLSIAERELGNTADAESVSQLALTSLQNTEGFGVWEEKVKCVQSGKRLMEEICLTQK